MCVANNSGSTSNLVTKTAHIKSLKIERMRKSYNIQCNYKESEQLGNIDLIY